MLDGGEGRASSIDMVSSSSASQSEATDGSRDQGSGDGVRK